MNNLQKSLAKVQAASRKFVMVEEKIVNEVMIQLAELLEKNVSKILKENAKDLAKMGKNDPMYDRVLLNEKRVKAMAASVNEIAGYYSPVDVELEHRVLANGLDLRKISVPFGVVGVIFEARPNVVIDIFALCFKSKNACVLKGGSQSEKSNEVLVKLILEAIRDVAGDRRGQKRGENGFMKDLVLLLKNDRKLLAEFMKQDKYVDVIIPRGGHGLINFVRENSMIPVIETGAGVVHTYFDEFGDLDKGREIVFNAKVSRPSVCNALDTLIIHKSRLVDLPAICQPMEEKKVEIFADKGSYKILAGYYSKNLLHKATGKIFGMEYLSLKMAIKTVASFDEALDHIANFGSKHSESIITENRERAEKFLKVVDAACVYVNASTRFTDGGEFGLGAEVGISTQKLHARGPMGIKELTSYKWLVRGTGQVRN
ncbi:glutamate-5-semialdehyde dehydrogenase [Candidatus Peregrinibacteria bacterium]|nr:glutamate-5-semialdehyde dehydrogenase [Candidatus Peregrinibacteria bacterium]